MRSIYQRSIQYELSFYERGSLSEYLLMACLKRDSFYHPIVLVVWISFKLQSIVSTN